MNTSKLIDYKNGAGFVIRHEVRSLTKQECEALLASRPDFQRNVRPTAVRRMAEEMTEGSWEYQGDPIRLSVTGSLIDGQHRVSAMLKANKFPPVLVISGFPDQIYDNLDNGLKRTMGDCFKLHGIKDSTAMAAISTNLWFYLVRGCYYDGGLAYRREEILQIYWDYKSEISFWKIQAWPFRDFFGSPTGLACVFTYAEIRGYDRSVLVDLLEQLRSGIGESSAMIALRKALVADNNKARRAITARHRSKMAYKAVAAALKGRALSQIRFGKEETFIPMPLVES